MIHGWSLWEYERGLGGRGERISGLDLEEEEEGGEWRTCWICVCSIGLVYYELELSNFNGEGGVCLLLFSLYYAWPESAFYNTVTLMLVD